MNTNRRKLKERYSELNRTLEELPEAGVPCRVDTRQEADLCRELARDGYVKIDHDGEREMLVKLTDDGMAFRRSGGYTLPKRDYSLATFVITTIAALSAMVAAAVSVLSLFRH